MTSQMGVMPRARRVLVTQGELNDRFNCIYRNLEGFYAALRAGYDIEADDDEE